MLSVKDATGRVVAQSDTTLSVEQEPLSLELDEEDANKLSTGWAAGWPVEFRIRLRKRDNASEPVQGQYQLTASYRTTSGVSQNCVATQEQKPSVWKISCSPPMFENATIYAALTGRSDVSLEKPIRIRQPLSAITLEADWTWGSLAAELAEHSTQNENERKVTVNLTWPEGVSEESQVPHPIKVRYEIILRPEGYHPPSRALRVNDTPLDMGEDAVFNVSNGDELKLTTSAGLGLVRLTVCDAVEGGSGCDTIAFPVAQRVRRLQADAATETSLETWKQRWAIKLDDFTYWGLARRPVNQMKHWLFILNATPDAEGRVYALVAFTVEAPQEGITAFVEPESLRFPQPSQEIKQWGNTYIPTGVIYPHGNFDCPDRRSGIFWVDPTYASPSGMVTVQRGLYIFTENIEQEGCNTGYYKGYVTGTIPENSLREAVTQFQGATPPQNGEGENAPNTENAGTNANGG